MIRTKLRWVACFLKAREICPRVKNNIVMIGVAMLPFSALAHDASSRDRANIEVCESATYFGVGIVGSLSAPYNKIASLTALLSSPLGKSVLKNLWVNHDRLHPCFAISNTPIWEPVVSRIPTDIVGIEVPNSLEHALIYVTGVPDYTIETPPFFTSFKPGNIYGVYKLAAEPKVDTRVVHEFASAGAIGLFVNGSSIFNYTDTFSYQNKGAWTYDANVAEASIVNSDVAHATPSNLPQFPKSRGIFHNHQMSREVLKQLNDSFSRGAKEHSKVIGYAIDSYPIYGPLGYSSRDMSSGVKVLKSSYVKRDWIAIENGGSNHRSSLPGWVVRGWNNDNTGDTLLNLSQKPKIDMLFTDGKKDGPVHYTGNDEKLAKEIQFLTETRGLVRDKEGYVYWESEILMPNGVKTITRNYLLRSSDLWGADISQKILPVSYQVADQDKFLFSAITGTFAEDYEFVPGYGDLDFFNGIESYVADRGQAIYHYVTPYSTDDVADKERLNKASFPYFVGVQFKGIVDTFNRATQKETSKAQYLTESRSLYKPVFDLGVVGKDANNEIQYASVIDTWRKTLSGRSH